MTYFKRFIPDFSTLTHPLRGLLKEGAEWAWSMQCQNTFDKLKNSLTSESCNAYFDERKETFVYTDASPVGISSIILQKSSEKKRP